MLVSLTDEGFDEFVFEVCFALVVGVSVCVVWDILGDDGVDVLFVVCLAVLHVTLSCRLPVFL